MTIKNILIAFTLCLLPVLIGCSDKPEINGGTDKKEDLKFDDFSFTQINNSGKILKDVHPAVDGTSLSATIPYMTDFKELVANFSANGKVMVNGVEQVSGVTRNDFSSDVVYKIVSDKGAVQEFTVSLKNSGLSVVHINTPNSASITSKEDWMEGAKMSISTKDGVDNYNGTTSIRGRGNSTWGYPKKPYALKLDSKAEILGMPKHKRWVLLANWMDRTMIRNEVAFEIARQTGLEWTPRGEAVEVALNGKHMGNYYLCEQIKIDKNRVNINEMSKSDVQGDAITGGYLMELDVNYDEVNKFKSKIRRLPFMFKEPDEEGLNTQQLNYMEQYISDTENSIYDDNLLASHDYEKYIDVDSYIDWWFVHELSMNWEPNHPKSTYMYKDKMGKLKAGLVWDFDWETFIPSRTDIFIVDQSLWFFRLFQDEKFVNRIKERWQTLKPKFDTIGNYIEKEGERLSVSAQFNFSLWPISSQVNGDEKMSYKDAIERMKSAYMEKVKWMDYMINNKL